MWVESGPLVTGCDIETKVKKKKGYVLSAAHGHMLSSCMHNAQMSANVMLSVVVTRGYLHLERMWMYLL